MAPTYRDEFPDDYTVPDAIATDPRLDDVSWHNDVCPSFTLKGYDAGGPFGWPDARLWVNHPVRDSREFMEQPRLMVTDGERAYFFQSENDDDAAAAVEALIAVCTRLQNERGAL